MSPLPGPSKLLPSPPQRAFLEDPLPGGPSRLLPPTQCSEQDTGRVTYVPESQPNDNDDDADDPAENVAAEDDDDDDDDGLENETNHGEKEKNNEMKWNNVDELDNEILDSKRYMKKLDAQVLALREVYQKNLDILTPMFYIFL